MVTDVRVVAPGNLTPEQHGELARCKASFYYFLRFWCFKNRETGLITTFEQLWQGQDDLEAAMETYPWLFILKAGKLGFSELECAYDGWVARFRQPNARVHLFSLGDRSSRELLGWVRFGLEHLPAYMQLPILKDQAGSDTSTSVKYLAGQDDVRTIVSYASSANISIDQSAQHAHVDEFARMPFGEKMWQAIETTVSPYGGTCHIVTRGSGPNFAARMWKDALAGRSKLHAFFAPYDARPGRKGDWYEGESKTLTNAGLWQWAPTSWQQAIQGDESYVYPQFDNPPGRHITYADPCPLQDCKKIAVGIDPGGGNPTAMGLWGERSSGRSHLYAEFYKPGVGADEIEEQLLEWLNWAQIGLGAPSRFKVFSPRDEPTLLATLKARGFDAHQAVADPVGGIRLITERLNTNGITVHADCVHHIEEFEDYRNSKVVDQLTRVEYAGERPLRHHADAMDEMRYAQSGLATWPMASEVITLPSGRRYRGRRS